MIEVFQEISREENCELKVKHGSSFSKIISFSPFTDEYKGRKIKFLSLRINYRNQIIDVLNEIGDIKLGKINCTLTKKLKLPEFKIGNRNRFLNLINRNVNLLKINCDNKDFENYIQNSLIELGLEEIAEDSQFEPTINGKQKENYEVTTIYSLSFDRKKDVIKPLINFYKSLIDFSFK